MQTKRKMNRFSNGVHRAVSSDGLLKDAIRREVQTGSQEYAPGHRYENYSSPHWNSAPHSSLHPHNPQNFQNLHNLPNLREYNRNNSNANETTHPDETDNSDSNDSDVLNDAKDWEILSYSTLFSRSAERPVEMAEAMGDASNGYDGPGAVSGIQIMPGEQYAPTRERAVSGLVRGSGIGRETDIPRESCIVRESNIGRECGTRGNEKARGFTIRDYDLPCHSNASDGQRRTSGTSSESNELNESDDQWSGWTSESPEDQVHGSPSSFLLNEFESILRWVHV